MVYPVSLFFIVMQRFLKKIQDKTKKRQWKKFGGDIAQTDSLKNRQLVDLYSDWLYFLRYGIIELM